MNMKYALSGLLVTAVLAGCAKAKDEADKKVTQAEMSGAWANDCSTTGFVSGVAGINSSRTFFNFYSDAGRTVQLYSDNACQSNIGSATYNGTSIIGGDSVAGDGARILDLNYTAVSVTINDDTAVTFANGLQTCGINDWAKGVARDVTAHAGDVNCAFTSAAGPVYDIVKTDGQTMFFGEVDATHDKKTDGARPVVLDKAVPYRKQ